MKIAIVGGGIGGLSAAIALEHGGHDVQVYERAEAYADVGSGLSLWPNALVALDAIGIGAEVRDRRAVVPPVEITDPRGRTLSRIDPVAFAERYGEIAMIHRADLLDVLRGRLADGTLRRGVEVTSVSADGTVRHTAGVSAFDLVVGADGVRSSTRYALWSHASEPRYAGYGAWRMITEPVRLDVAGEVWGRGARFGYAPLPDGRAYCFAVVGTPPGVQHHGLDEISRRFAGWHQPIPALLDATDPAAVLYHDLYEAPRLQSYVCGRVVLLGDAAHGMTPNLGQGAGQAIEDAVSLGTVVANGDDLAAYDRLRLRRTRGIAARSRMLGRLGQLASSPAAGVRDAVMRATPSSAVLRSFASVLDWRPPA